MKLQLLLTSLFVLLFSQNSFSQLPSRNDTTELAGYLTDTLEKEAAFPGGDDAWRQFLSKSMKSFNPANNGAPSGYYTAVIQFVVAKDGSTSDVKALSNEGYGIEDEVKKVILRSGKWDPATINGEPVIAYRKQPVTFIVENEGIQFQSQTPYVLHTGSNEVIIHVNKIKDENLMATITKGTIVPTGNGIFKVRVSAPGKVVISVFNAKNDKLLGAARYTVESVSDKSSNE